MVAANAYGRRRMMKSTLLAAMAVLLAVSALPAVVVAKTNAGCVGLAEVACRANDCCSWAKNEATGAFICGESGCGPTLARNPDKCVRCGCCYIPETKKCVDKPAACPAPKRLLLEEDTCSCADVCFPATSTMRRLSATGTWETVTLPELRIGDTVQCYVRQPALSTTDGSFTSTAGGELSTCQVYDYKKAMPATTTAEYTLITYDRPESARPGVLVASANHHVLSPETGKAIMAGSIAVDDLLMIEEDGAVTTARVLSVAVGPAPGAYVPLLTKGGLPVVDGTVAYPSSGSSDVGLDAKHWGQYFLSAPVWQALDKANTKGQTLAELGAREGFQVGAFTQKFYAVAAAAAQEGRTFKDWAGVAAEIHSAISVEGKVYSEEEALAVYDRHIVAPPQVMVTVA